MTKEGVASRVLPLSKFMHPADLDLLQPELKTVNRHFNADRPQHGARRWEYAMALRALEVGGLERGSPYSLLADVGGAGSPLRYMTPRYPWVIDPDRPDGMTLRAAVRSGGRTQAALCISVLEHVENLEESLADLDVLVLPGGMLFLTVDVQEQEGPDKRHFHWMRKRIFSPESWKKLLYFFLERDWKCLGWADDRWRGAHVYDYNFASLAVRKERR